MTIMVTLENPETGAKVRRPEAAEYPGYEGWLVVASEEWPTLDMLKAAKCAQVDARLAQAIVAGYTPDAGPLAGHTLQVRDNSDLTNWLASHVSYSDQAAAGNGQKQAIFRTAANETVAVTFEQGAAVIASLVDWRHGLMQNCWTLKDQIAAATDAVALDAVDSDAGWSAS